MAKGIYLDNSTTTIPSDKALAKMIPLFKEMWGAPLAPHSMGQKLYHLIDESYQSIYRSMQAKDEDLFVLTSSGAESVNHVMTSVYHTVTDPTGRNQYICAESDEASILMSLSRLETMGCHIKMVKPDINGRIDPESILEAITPRTALVSLSFVNGITGVVNPIDEISQICQKRGIQLHLDVTHALGRIYFDKESINPTYLTFNGDHLHAPKGTGGLFVKNGTKLLPFILGSLDQAGFRAGSLNVPSLASLSVALEETFEAQDYICTEIARLKNKFEVEILRRVPESKVIFGNSERVPTTSVIAFPGISNELMLYNLNRKGVFASIGGGPFQQIALVLTSSGLDENLANCALNFTLSRETTEDEIDQTIEVIVECVKRLRKISSKII